MTVYNDQMSNPSSGYFNANYGSPYGGDYDVTEGSSRDAQGNPKLDAYGVQVGRELNAQNFLNDDGTQLRSLLPAAFQRRNAALSSMIGQLRGPSFQNLYEAGGADQSVMAARGARQRVKSALAARGLMQSGAESSALRGVEKGYGSNLLDAIRAGSEMESQRKAKLAQGISGISATDLQVLEALQQSELEKYSAETGTNIRRQDAGADVALGVGETVKLIASLAAGAYGASAGSAQAGAGGAAGSTGAAGFANNFQMAQSIGSSGKSSGGISLPSGQATYDTSGPTNNMGNGPRSMGPTTMNDAYDRKIRVPAGADNELLQQLYYAGVY